MHRSDPQIQDQRGAGLRGSGGALRIQPVYLTGDALTP